MTMERIKIVIIDDHQVLIDGIKSILSTVDHIMVTGEAVDGNAGLMAVNEKQPDVVLLDINMPDMDGIETCQLIVADHPSVKIIALTMHDDYSYIQKMMDKGAHGYLLKNSGKDEIVLAIEQVYQGRHYYSTQVTRTLIDGMRDEALKPAVKEKIKLTRREKQVLALIVEGLTSPEIADRLYIGVSTAETHRKNLLRKLDVGNSAALVRVAIDQKLIDR